LDQPSPPIGSARHVPTRTCVGCRKACPAPELVRLVLHPGPAPRLAVHTGPNRPPGRGAWIHPRDFCVGAAIRANAFGRAFRASIPPLDASALLASILGAR
jgi:predicted RNA-binding protein YlxR (DUF448 family)